MSSEKNEDVVIDGVTYRYVVGVHGSYQYRGPDGAWYRKHKNGGGLVGQDANVEPSVYVGAGSRVFGTARLRDAVRLTGRAQVGGMVDAEGTGTFYGSTYLTGGFCKNFGLKEIDERKE